LRVFSARQDVRGPENRHEADRLSRESVRPTLLPVDHADRGSADEPRLSEGVHRLLGCAPTGDDILDEADLFAGIELALDAPLGPVALRLLADDEERKAPGEGGRRGQGDRTELGPGQAPRFGGRLGDACRDPLAELTEQVRPRLEPVLVQVVAGSPPLAQHEIPFEERVLAEEACELCVRHPRAAASARRASGSSRSPSEEPDSSETIEPSAK
jgi:hypothetical protein